jgi:ParB family chromosome partitioning protein
LEAIECFFHEGTLSDSEILEQQLIENLLREELNPMEEARAYARLMEVNGWNGKQVAEALHIPTSKVSRCLAMLKLPKEVQQLVAESKVSARSAYELSKITDVDRLTRLAELAYEGKLTHEQAAAVSRS